MSATTWTSPMLTSKVTLSSSLAGAGSAPHRGLASETSLAHDRGVRVAPVSLGGQRPWNRAAGTYMATETRPLDVPLGKLERSLIDEFIRGRGYDPHQLVDLPEGERERLLTDASIYASMKLVEVEARSHFLDKIHDGGVD